MSAVLQPEPPFPDTHSALKFAFRFNYENYETSALSEMASSPRPVGRGLSGLDGAGVAGDIGIQLATLPQLWRRMLVARHSISRAKCQFCSDGHLYRTDWLIEVAWVSGTVWLDIEIPRLKYMPKVRDGMVCRFFGGTVSLKSLAKEAGVTDDTMTQYNNQLVTVLKREEKSAHRAIDERFRTAGLVP